MAASSRPSNKQTHKERSVAFFEVVEVVDGELVRIPQLDWESVLKVLEKADVADRTYDEGPRDVIGEVFRWSAARRLLMHRLRDGADWLSEIDWSAGDIAQIEAAQGKGWLDTSVFHFASFGNIVALIQGSANSPGHTVLDAYIKFLAPFEGVQLAVRPLVGKAEIERLQQADELGRIEMKLGAKHAKALQGKKGSLAKMFKLARKFGDVDVTLILSVPRRKQNSAERINLLNEVRDIQELLPLSDRAKATLYYGPENEAAATRIVELVEHNISVKRLVLTRDEKGEPLKISGAYTTIDGTIDQLEPLLREASDSVGPQG